MSERRQASLPVAMGSHSQPLERVETGDGSVTYRLGGTEVTYRSVHGARTEAKHVFLDAAGLVARPGPWRVVELGFGLGTSFRVTARAALALGVSLEFCSLERAPVASAYIEGEDVGARLARRALDVLRSGHAEAAVEEGPISLRVVVANWLDDWRWFPAHAVYFDPFGPRVEPESWTLSCFERARSCMEPDAILSTYSAAGQVRRNMAAAGLYVATAPGPTFKREITLGSTSPAVLVAHQVVKRPVPKQPG